MKPIKHRLEFVCRILVGFAFSGQAIWAEVPSLQKGVEKELLNSTKAVLVVDPQNGAVEASIRPEVFLQGKYPVSSLIKAFSLIAFYREHGNSFPVLNCPATLANDHNGCWDRNGHGKVGATKAIAFSCNVYFRQLSARISTEIFAQTLTDFGIIANSSEISTLPEEIQRKIMVGNTNNWSVSPYNILRAYCALWNGGHLWNRGTVTSGKVPILPESLLSLLHDGLLLGCAEGTSLEASKISGTKLLGKTGTSLSYSNGQTDWNRTQGWWIGLYPTEHPRIAIMTFVPGGRGAVDAAPLGGKVLAIYLHSGLPSNEK
jgi:cell division protein FtsI/penicillin-binding protein 2